MFGVTGFIILALLDANSLDPLRVRQKLSFGLTTLNLCKQSSHCFACRAIVNCFHLRVPAISAYAIVTCNILNLEITVPL